MTDQIQLRHGERALRIIGVTSSILVVCYHHKCKITYGDAEKIATSMGYLIPSFAESRDIFYWLVLDVKKKYWIKSSDTGQCLAMNGGSGRVLALNRSDKANMICIRRIPIVEAE